MQTEPQGTSPADEVELTVVIPCLNESETLAICVRKALASFEELDVRGEVVVGDNGSTDGSQDIAREAGARVVDVEEKGYGNALRGGILAARGRFIIMGDADDSYDFSNIGGFVTEMRAGSDLVMGCRFPSGGGRIAPGAMPPMHQWFGNPFLSALGRLFFRSKVHDFYCGLRGFTAEAFRRMNLQTTGMEFALEMVAKASLTDMRVTEVPITLHPDGRSHPPHLRTFRDGWRSLRFFLMYSPRWLFVYPGLLLMLAGLAGMIWLLPGARTVGDVSIDVHTMLIMGVACIVGYQALWFAAMAKAFAMSQRLLPYDERFSRLLGVFSLEVLLIVGMVLVVGGIGMLVGAFSYWRMQSFGPLDYSVTMRLVIPAAVILSVGAQTVFSSFLSALLNLPRRLPS